jgi:ATP-dependent DNA helicase UvrD/PcrA
MMAEAPRVYRPRERGEPSAPDERPNVAAELNAEQAAAATHGDGPLLIVAGAGTGKTRTLVYRVAHLLANGAQPERVLLLTFTRRAAHEMLSRAERLVGSVSGRVHGGTFHGTGNRLLRMFGQAAGLPRDFSIMDQGDAVDKMGLARANLGYGKQEKRFPKKETLHYIYSRHINTELAVEDILGSELPQFVDYTDDIVRIFAEYTSQKHEQNLVDYDDLLLFWALMLEQSEALAERIASLYDHILVDEYQDTNVLQARILRGMCRSHRNITVVGDDAQSVYSFRGANVHNILDFPQQFPGTQLVTLEQNYRSTQPILDVTNTLISRAAARYTKSLWTRRGGGEAPWLVAGRDEQQQTKFVVDRVLELHEEGIPLREIAVLFRAAYMSADLEIELANRRIPFEKWGGLKFLEAAHVKDVLAFLRVLENPRDDVSWYRLLMLMPGIGDVTARSAIASMEQAGWHEDAFGAWQAPHRAREAHQRLVSLLDVLRDATATTGPGTNASVSAQIEAIRGLYDDILRERYDRPEARLADLEQLRVISAGYPSRTAFLSAIALEPPQNTQDLAGGGDAEDDALILSTAHSAKGKEWDAVFLIWAVDGHFPLARAAADEEQLEEERRLMYVAMTRARNHLIVSYPLNVYSTRRGADYSMDQLSRFIDAGVRAKMQRVVLTDDSPPTPVPSIATRQPEIDLRAILKSRFAK